MQRFPTPGLDPVEQAVESLTATYGTLFVIAAGNDHLSDRVTSPGSADSALTVGAVDRSDELADFSLKGPRIGDAGLKPDITAPGVDIVAARSADGYLGEAGRAYLTLSGTSMATPHVAGAAAILAQRYPDWGPARWKAALMGSAEPHATLNPYAPGAGRVDVARAVEQRVTLTADTRTAPAGQAGGHLIAAGGDAVVRTPFAVDVEGPHHDVQFVHTGRDGRARHTRPGTAWNSRPNVARRPCSPPASPACGTSNRARCPGHNRCG